MADYVDRGLRKVGITISKPMLAVICIIFGIMVIIFPSLLVWIVGLFLIVQGTLLLTDLLEQGRSGTAVNLSRSVFCAHCGTGNMEEAAYCKKCGKKLERVPQKTT